LAAGLGPDPLGDRAKALLLRGGEVRGGKGRGGGREGEGEGEGELAPRC